MGEYAFAYCDFLTRVTLAEGITIVGDTAFGMCDVLKDVSLPNTLTELGDGAFLSCPKIESLTIPDNVETIKKFTFFGCDKLAYVKLPANLKKIKESAFDNCSVLENPEFPEGLESIDAGAYMECSKIDSITLPASLKELNGNPFAQCENLKRVTVASGNKNFTVKDDILYTSDMTTLIMYPTAKEEDTLVIDEGITKIGDYAVFDHPELKRVVFPESVTEIGELAFANDINMVELKLPSNITDIGVGAFRRCWSIADVTVPKSVKRMGDEAFSRCYNLCAARFEGDAPEISTEFSSTNVFYAADKDFKIYCLAYKSGWTTPKWNDYPCEAVSSFDDIKIDFVSRVKINSTPDDKGMVFTASIDSLDYKEVGFIFEADGKQARRSTDTVYTSIEESEYELVEFYGGKYIYSFEIDDIADRDKDIKVTAYAIDLDGNEILGKSDTICLSDFDDTLFALSSQRGSLNDDTETLFVNKAEAIIDDNILSGAAIESEE